MQALDNILFGERVNYQVLTTDESKVIHVLILIYTQKNGF